MPPDREMLAAIGEVVVDAAVLEYFMAVLVAVIESRDEEWARKQVAQPGAARRAMERLVNGRPDRPDLGRLYQDAAAVLDDRHRIAHSIAQTDMGDAADEPGMSLWNPRKNIERRITAPQVLAHARDIRIVTRRARALFAAEISDVP